MRGNPNPTKKIQKGQVLNPNGPKPNPPEWHMMKRLTKPEFEVIINKVLKLPIMELKEYGNTAIESMIASFVYNAYKYGDPGKVEGLLNRLFGKVADKVDVSITNYLKDLTDDELIQEAERLLEERKQLMSKEKLCLK